MHRLVTPETATKPTYSANSLSQQPQIVIIPKNPRVIWLRPQFPFFSFLSHRVLSSRSKHQRLCHRKFKSNQYSFRLNIYPILYCMSLKWENKQNRPICQTSSLTPTEPLFSVHSPLREMDIFGWVHVR